LVSDESSTENRLLDSTKAEEIIVAPELTL